MLAAGIAKKAAPVAFAVAILLGPPPVSYTP
jgi:hypothetical protein